MGREIKFRAWESQQKEMRTLQPNWSMSVLNDNAHYSVLQFTGLNDKNGKEIYEGDIVEVYSYVSEQFGKIDRTAHAVCWMGPEYPACDLDGWEGESNGLAELEQSGEWECEVIGNIYENPELLK